jgi:hypothetical protein
VIHSWPGTNLAIKVSDIRASPVPWSFILLNQLVFVLAISRLFVSALFGETNCRVFVFGSGCVFVFGSGYALSLDALSLMHRFLATRSRGALSSRDARPRCALSSLDARFRCALYSCDARSRCALSSRDARSRCALYSRDTRSRCALSSRDARPRCALY